MPLTATKIKSLKPNITKNGKIVRVTKFNVQTAFC